MKIVSCGALKKELKEIFRKHAIKDSTQFLPVQLHNNPQKLGLALDHWKNKAHSKQESLVFLYGYACHPQITEKNKQTWNCQNCLELLLGHDFYHSELKAGAYFLLESLVEHWEFTHRKMFGDRMDVLREIFQDSHKYLLALQTPCSAPDKFKAEKISQLTGLELRWKKVELSLLEKNILEMLKP